MESHKPTIIFEHARAGAAKSYGYTEQLFFQFFSSLGYELYDIFGRQFGLNEFRSPWTDPQEIPWYQMAICAENQGPLNACEKRWQIFLGDPKRVISLAVAAA